MKKVKYIIIAIAILIGMNSLIFAHEENANPMQQMFQQKVMIIQNSFMKEIKSQVDKDTAKAIDDMIQSHRQDMKKFIQLSKNMTDQEKMQYRMKMKKKHFRDLKRVLNKYPKLYWKYAAKMDLIMGNIMKIRAMIKNGSNMPIDSLSFTNGLPNNIFNKIDIILNKYYKKLSSLPKQDHINRLAKIINRIDQKLSLIDNNDPANNKKRAILSYIKNHIKYHLDIIK